MSWTNNPEIWNSCKVLLVKDIVILKILVSYGTAIRWCILLGINRQKTLSAAQLSIKDLKLFYVFTEACLASSMFFTGASARHKLPLQWFCRPKKVSRIERDTEGSQRENRLQKWQRKCAFLFFCMYFRYAHNRDETARHTVQNRKQPALLKWKNWFIGVGGIHFCRLHDTQNLDGEIIYLISMISLLPGLVGGVK